MDKLFIIVCDADPRIMTDVAFMYARNAIKNGWMSEVIVILWGPSQRTLVGALELKAEAMSLNEIENISVWACKECSDNYQITEKLENLDVTVKYIGEDVSNMLKEGWCQLSF